MILVTGGAGFSCGRPQGGLNLLRRLAFTETGLERVWK
jgi:hypothetical protein